MSKKIFADPGDRVGENLRENVDISPLNHHITIYTENGVRKAEAWLQIGKTCFSVVNTIINDEVI